MSTFIEEQKQKLKMLLDSRIKTVKSQLPKYRDAFEQRVRDEIERPAHMAIEKIDAIRSGGRFSPSGERKELHLTAHGFAFEHLGKVRAATVEKLEEQRKAREAALFAAKKPPSDPALALVHELRLQELRRELRARTPVERQALLKQAVTSENGALLLEAIDTDPVAAAGGQPIAPADALREARAQLALSADPESGEVAQLGAGYTFCIGVAEQVVLAAAGLSKLEASFDPTPAAPAAPKPHTLSGTPVPEVTPR